MQRGATEGHRSGSDACGRSGGVIDPRGVLVLASIAYSIGQILGVVLLLVIAGAAVRDQVKKRGGNN